MNEDYVRAEIAAHLAGDESRQAERRLRSAPVWAEIRAAASERGVELPEDYRKAKLYGAEFDTLVETLGRPLCRKLTQPVRELNDEHDALRSAVDARAVGCPVRSGETWTSVWTSLVEENRIIEAEVAERLGVEHRFVPMESYVPGEWPNLADFQVRIEDAEVDRRIFLANVTKEEMARFREACLPPEDEPDLPPVYD